MHVQEASAVPLCPRHGSCDCRVPAERHLGFGAEVSDVELTCADVPGDDEGCLGVPDARCGSEHRRVIHAQRIENHSAGLPPRGSSVKAA